ncbi:MAG: hypothetical protein M3Z23_03685 [Acidobacteriota bacterium]|nr:hypothetical protein [Acidobacteriota bacterium]
MKTSQLLVSVLAGLSTCAWAQSEAPVIRANGTVNAADYSRVFAPGAIISIFGDNLASSKEAASTLPLPTSLGGATVEVIDGETITPLPLYFASPGQLNAQLPYNLTGQAVQIRVRSAGASNTDSITLTSRAPRLFSIGDGGTGTAILQTADASLVTKANPVTSGSRYVLYLNSLGATSPAAVAGAPSGSGDGLQKVMDPVSVSVNGNPATVTFAGLTPGLTGLYQLNFQAPYDRVTGDVSLAVSVGSSVSQNAVTVPVQPNGFYFVLTGGKVGVNGQMKDNLSGLNSPVAYRHEDQRTWGPVGYKAWTTQLEVTDATTPTAGLALTLKNGASVVYDNNGMETNTVPVAPPISFGRTNYYDNSDKAVRDANKAGLYEAYCMSNYLPAVFAGYFKLTSSTTFTQIIGYFDPNGTAELRFNPSDPNFTYRMNIYSNVSGRQDLPKETGSFVGDVFSSDRTAGTFAFSDTTYKRVFSDGATDPIFRMVYTLASPVTLPAGEYWFTHDAAVPVRFSADDDNSPGPQQFTTKKESAAPGTSASNVTIARPKALLSAAH